MVQYIVLSLEMLCYLYIFNHLERFASEALSQLPRKIRHLLLTRLPAVDVIQLERTAVSVGVDGNEVWKRMYVDRISVSVNLENLPFDYGTLTFTDNWKDHYIAVVLYCLFNERSLFNVHMLLFGVRNFHNPGFVSTDTRMYVRPCYSHIHRICNSQNSLIDYLMKRYQVFPKLLYFPCTTVYRYTQYTMLDILVCFFNQVQDVLFLCHTQVTDQSCGLEAQIVLEILLSSKNPALQSVMFEDYCMISKVYTLFCLKAHVPEVSKYNALLNLALNIPYTKLKRICIFGHRCRCKSRTDSEANILVVTHGLFSIILSQKTLESIHFCMWPHFKSLTMLFSTLHGCLQQFTFRSLILKETNLVISAQSLQQLLQAFFESPCDENQTILLRSCLLSLENPPARLQGMERALSNQSLKNKSLILRNVSISEAVESLLFGYPLLSLKSLELSHLKSTGPDEGSLRRHGTQQYCPLKTALQLLARNTISQIETLILKDTNFMLPSSIFDYPLLSALQSPRLRVLVVSGCNFNPKILVCSIVQQLLLQKGSLASLEVLDVSKSRLGELPQADITRFFGAVLTQLTLSTLTLDLSHNDLTNHHFTLFYRLWREKSLERRLRCLICAGNKISEDLLETTVNWIADEVDPDRHCKYVILHRE